MEKFVPALSFNRLTVYFDVLMHTFLPEKKFKSALIEQANIQPGNRILDFGAGTATLTMMAKQQQPGADFYGVDVDPVITGIAIEKIKKAGMSIQIGLYDGITLPYHDGFFDKVISSLTFHHLTTDQKHFSLKEIHRILKPGGELHIADWGRPQNYLMRLLFYFVQIFDGFGRTSDNVKGLLPGYIEQTGFREVKELQRFATIVGTLTLYKGNK
ncbi:MAG: class I SAM-dependent methyltransferase [Bacteroidetes bacterium]|nr:class I SAM-dependent methyltransferase [Bacteroidota bacterium]